MESGMNKYRLKNRNKSYYVDCVTTSLNKNDAKVFTSLKDAAEAAEKWSTEQRDCLPFAIVPVITKPKARVTPKARTYHVTVVRSQFAEFTVTADSEWEARDKALLDANKSTNAQWSNFDIEIDSMALED